MVDPSGSRGLRSPRGVPRTGKKSRYSKRQNEFVTVSSNSPILASRYAAIAGEGVRFNSTLRVVSPEHDGVVRG